VGLAFGLGLLESQRVQKVKALELVLIKQDTHCLFQEINASEEIGEVQKFVDLLLDFLLLLNDQPILGLAVDERKGPVYERANVAGGSVFSGLDLLKIGRGEPNLKEVGSKVVDEKEDCEDRGEDSSHIREYVHQLQIGTIYGSRGWRTFEDEEGLWVGSSLGEAIDGHDIASDTSDSGDVLVREKTVISVDDRFIQVDFIFIVPVWVDLDGIPVDPMGEGMTAVVRVGYGVHMIDIDMPAAARIAGG
jgi:hypothetical protein